MQNRQIGDRIKQRRLEMGISATEIAAATGLSRTTITRYETGEIKNIKLPVIESIAVCLKCNPAWLVAKSEEKYIHRDGAFLDPVESIDLSDALDEVLAVLDQKSGLKYKGLDLTPSAKRSLLEALSGVKSKIDDIYGF